MKVVCLIVACMFLCSAVDSTVSRNLEVSRVTLKVSPMDFLYNEMLPYFYNPILHIIFFVYILVLIRCLLFMKVLLK